MTAFADRVFVFTGATLEQALDDWVAEQLAAYPHQEARIRVAALAMRDFFGSRHIERHKMTLGRQSDGPADGGAGGEP
ncbi:hypothetical protein [uncultured Thiohalocapsa sp.]|jgi:hypothetical protein|uniref:hypothetical protein n=1 Tax=uncultured Thiohalocapsa sp. TaxID=768990 RepID=UPI0025F52F9E|nr:hypothetical protein [uncultured Thiohalocapsa sp.]